MSFEMDLINMPKVKKKLDLQEVTSSKILNVDNDADEEGLASNEIFGNAGSVDRKRKYAYISLGDTFIHPHVYYVLSSLPGGRNILIPMFRGEVDCYIDKHTGYLVPFKVGDKIPDGVKSGTGIAFFYKYFDEIKLFRRSYDNKSADREEKIKFIKALSKEEIFIKDFIVIPLYYRDVDLEGGKKNEINTMYIRLINNASLIKSTGMTFNVDMVTKAHINVIDICNELYDYFMSFNTGNKGFMHKAVIGKNTDFSARLVLSGATYNNENYENMDVTFDKSLIPLYVIVKCFAPYIVHGIKNIINHIVANGKFAWVYDKSSKTWTREELIETFMEKFSTDNIYKMIELFHTSLEHRLDIITVRLHDKREVPLYYVQDKHIDSIQDMSPNSEVLKGKPLTMLELMYMATYDTVRDKHVYITRYPIEDYNNIYPSKMTILPYKTYNEREMFGKIYPKYPIIDKENDLLKLDALFTDTLRIFPGYLSAIGADFDGDMCSVQGVWSKEANAEADTHIDSVQNIVNIAGGTMRDLAAASIHTLYNLTRDPD